MDVSCPRCKTEYEFDDARVPEGGVTVKCTNCSYVFRVKRSESPSGEVPRPPPTQPDPLLPPSSAAGSTREWKVRQPSGNVFHFRELTTLQKWIVERKVARQDEISLTGETWKRLGDIPELASFFIVVDEAMKAARLEAEQAGAPPPSAPPPEPLPQVSQPAPRTRRTTEPELPAVQAPPEPEPEPLDRPIARDPSADQTMREPRAAHRPRSTGPVDPKAIGRSVLETLKAPDFSSPAVSPSRPVQIQPEPEFDQPMPRPRPSAPRPSAPRRPPPQPEPPQAEQRSPRQLSAPLNRDWEAPQVQRPSNTGLYVSLLLVALLSAGAGYWYLEIYSPEQARLEGEGRAEKDRLAEEQAKKAEEARVKAEAEEKDRKDKEALAAAAAAAAAKVVDAGPPDAGVKAAAVIDAGVPVKHDFEWYLAQGDRYRDREKHEKALEMYGQAADLEPERCEPIAGRGLALLDLGKHLQAEASFQEALKLNGRYAPAIMGLAETYRVMNKNEQAVEWYQKYLDVLPNGPEANVAKSNIERLKPKADPAP